MEARNRSGSVGSWPSLILASLLLLGSAPPAWGEPLETKCTTIDSSVIVFGTWRDVRRVAHCGATVCVETWSESDPVGRRHIRPAILCHDPQLADVYLFGMLADEPSTH